MRILLLGPNSPRQALLKEGLLSNQKFEVTSVSAPEQIAALTPLPELIFWDATEQKTFTLQKAETFRLNPKTKDIPIVFLANERFETSLAYSDCWMHPIVDSTDLIIKLTRVNIGILDRPVKILLFEQKREIVDLLRKQLASANCKIELTKGEFPLPGFDMIISSLVFAKESDVTSSDTEIPIFLISDTIDSQQRIFGFYNYTFKTFCGKIHSLFKP